MTKPRALAFLLASLLYLLSPVDLLPDFMPLVGWLDDAVLVGLAVWTFLEKWKPPRRDAGPAPLPGDPYAVLGVAPGASRDEIKRAYREQMALYHPDKVAHLGEDLKRVAHQKTLAIDKAYRELLAQ